MVSRTIIIFQPSIPDELAIEDRYEQTIIAYFSTLNIGDYQQTAELFALDGILSPPYGSDIIGRDAIKNYLAKEAIAIKLITEQGSVSLLDTGEMIYRVTGKVQTPLLSVNVLWEFNLNIRAEIQSVKVSVTEGF